MRLLSCVRAPVVMQLSSQVHSMLLLRRVFLAQQVHIPLSSHAGRLVDTCCLQPPWRRQLQLVATSSEAGRHVSGCSQLVVCSAGRRGTPTRLGGRQGHVQRRQSTTSSSPTSATRLLIHFISWSILLSPISQGSVWNVITAHNHSTQAWRPKHGSSLFTVPIFDRIHHQPWLWNKYVSTRSTVCTLPRYIVDRVQSYCLTLHNGLGLLA